MMIRLAGKQKNSVKYHYQGYIYHNDGRGSSTIFRCSERNRYGCRAVIYVENFYNIDHENHTVEVGHNHPRDNLYMLKEQFKNELKELAKNPQQDFPGIYKTVIEKQEYAALVDEPDVQYHKCLSLMRVAKATHVPPIPGSLRELSETLPHYHAMKNFYRGCAVGTDGSIGLIFIHESMMQPLSECKQLFCDGTFDLRPDRPSSAQIFTIHFRKMNMGFAAIYVIASSKTTAFYDAMWDKIFELIPTLQNNIELVTSDFERAQINSAKRKFPNARIAGCVFHYKQAVVKRWEKQSIPMEYEYILEKAYALAYLPANKIEEGMHHLTSLVDRLAERVQQPLFQKLQAFTTYLRTYWLPLADVLSAYQRPIKSNNISETFHLHAGKYIGLGQVLYKFLASLLQLAKKIGSNYANVELGHLPPSTRPRELQSADLQLLNAEREFELGRYSVEEFLTHVAGLRRYHLARVFQYNEGIREITAQNNDDSMIGDNFTIQDLGYLTEELAAETVPGGEFENRLRINRRGRDYIIQDAEQMPGPIADPIIAAPRRRRRQQNIPAVVEARAERARRGRPPQNVNAAAAAERPLRRRGRPRRNPPEPVINEPEVPVNENHADGVVQEEVADRPRVDNNVDAVEERPIARRRGRPRQRQNQRLRPVEELADPANENQEQVVPEEVADRPGVGNNGNAIDERPVARRRGRPRQHRPLVEEPTDPINENHAEQIIQEEIADRPGIENNVNAIEERPLARRRGRPRQNQQRRLLVEQPANADNEFNEEFVDENSEALFTDNPTELEAAIEKDAELINTSDEEYIEEHPILPIRRRRVLPNTMDLIRPLFEENFIVSVTENTSDVAMVRESINPVTEDPPIVAVVDESIDLTAEDLPIMAVVDESIDPVAVDPPIVATVDEPIDFIAADPPIAAAVDGPIDLVAENPPIVAVVKRRAKKRKITRRGSTNGKCSVVNCDERRKVNKLWPCGHRICITCVTSLIKQACPLCRTEIKSYLPLHMMGGEKWHEGIPLQLEMDFTNQLLRDYGFVV